MSLRAIQKRDRNKLSSAQQKQQQQHQQQLFINKSRSSSFGTTPVGTIGISSVGGGQLHRQSSSSNSKNEKWRNSASQASLSSSTSIPSSSVQPSLTHAKRSVSYPSLQKRSTSNATSLRFTKSESDLHGQSGRTAAVASNNQPDLASSANNLYLGAKSEVCLKTLAVKSTHQPPAPFRRQSSSSGQRGGGNRMYESNRRTSDLGGADKLAGIGINNNGVAVRIPIIGYEVMEERARFTVSVLLACSCVL